MCGYVGLLRRSASDSLSVEARESIAHRGPDDQVRLETAALDLFFARLAIVGVENGRQPLVDENTGVISVVNGEIYNAVELRSQLTREGFKFRSESDAEAVLWGFLKWKRKVFEVLDGMWSAAIFDPRDGSLTLSRDRLGKKPLYWRESPQGLVFASELSGLGVSRSECWTNHVAEFVSLDAISWRGNCSCGITEVTPGSSIVFHKQTHSVETFWTLRSAVLEARLGAASPAGRLKKFQDLLTASVKKRLISDVPIGMFLSDGMDSQLVAAIAQKTGRLECAYTLQFQDSSFDEYDRARAFAEELGVVSERVRANLDDLAAMWSILKETIDDPVADAAYLGQMLLAQSASKRTKVVLTGDGGDELFLGYQHVLAHRLLRFGPFLATAQSKFFERLSLLARKRFSEGYFSLGFIMERLGRGLDQKDLLARDLAWRVSVAPAFAEALLGPEGKALRSSAVASAVAPADNSDLSTSAPWDVRWSTHYVENYLRNVILRKVDRATMRFGVEARSPLLDAELTALSVGMPLREKSTFFSPKKPLKAALKSEMAKQWRPRRKHGMGIPLASLLQGPLSYDLRAFTAPEFVESIGLSPKTVEVMRDRFYQSPHLFAREMWALLVFGAWSKRVGATS